MRLSLQTIFNNYLCLHAEKLHQEAMENVNNKIMRHNYINDDPLTMCYFDNDCSGPGIQTPPGVDCCTVYPMYFQKRPSPAGLICCSW